MANHKENKFFLGSYVKSKPEHSDYYLMRSINTAEMESISIALKQLGDFDSYCRLYEICEKNYQLILSYHSSIKDDFPSYRGRSQEYLNEAFYEITCLLLNYLSSFKTYYDHFTTRYTRLERKGYSFYTDYVKITEACYDSSFSYRFFTKLRDYVQHCGLPLGEVAIYEQPKKDGDVEIHVSTSLNRDSLLGSYKKWKKVKAELQSQPEYMELLLYLNEFQSQIQEINSLVTDFELSLVADSWQILWEIINEVQSQYPDGSPFIGQYKKTDGGLDRVLTNHFPIHTMIRLEEKLGKNKYPMPQNAKSILKKAQVSAKNYVEMLDIVTVHHPIEELDT